MAAPFVRRESPTAYRIGNETFELSVSAVAGATPALDRIALESRPDIDWAAAPHAFAPRIDVRGAAYHPAAGTMSFVGFEAADNGQRGPELLLRFRLANGLDAVQHVRPSPARPVWRSWVEIANPTGSPLDGITRFDAFNGVLSTSGHEPMVAYLLGWMEGPRADAPAHPSLPYRYGGWIPKFLYGEGAVIPPPPEGGWTAGAFRLVQERLTRLPLRSGKRSTYENSPWMTVMDPGRRAGWFIGFEWSGTWRMNAERLSDDRAVTVSVSSDGCTHALAPGQTLVSPPAFVGLFSGDWDDAFNACRRFVREEILPPCPEDWPTALHVHYFHNNPAKRSDEFVRKEIEAAAATGFETTYIETVWWKEGADPGDFSIGLGSFEDSREKFPMGIRGYADRLRAKGMKLGLWFEIERVDIRTANRLRRPWKPEWIVHQNGYPYRSWCQHAYLLCLGVKEAQDWAIENLSRAIDEYGVDWLMLDSNEWAVCDDANHGHGAGEGEWAQIHGLYRVLGELGRRFPRMTILNSAGGGQRSDFGMARFCHIQHHHDDCVPSLKQRRFLHGLGCLYPNYYTNQGLSDYAEHLTNGRWDVPAATVPGTATSRERMEWRGLNRILGGFTVNFEMGAMPEDRREILRRLLATYKRIRRALYGDRYVLAAPQPAVEKENREAEAWEAYENLSVDGSLAAVFLYRCLSHEPTFTARLRGLDAGALYRIDSHGGRVKGIRTGAQLMDDGIAVTLESTRRAEVLILEREGGAG